MSIEEKFQTLLSDVMRQGAWDQVSVSIDDMKAFLANVKEQASDGGALPVENYEHMENLGQMMIKNAKMTHESDALFAELETAMEINPDGISEELLARLQEQSAAMMEQMPPDFQNASPLPENVEELFDAIEEENETAVRDLVKVVDINGQFGQFQKSPLFHALTNCEAGCAIPNLLLDLGADPRVGMADGYTPLHGIAGRGFELEYQDEVSAIVKRLIDAGADIEARTTSYGWTPVQYAVSEMEPGSLRALLLAGALVEPDYQLNDRQNCVKGPSTIDAAAAFPDVLSVLLEFGADPNRADNQGESAIVRLEQSANRNRGHISSIVARGKTPDRNELSVSEGYETCLELMRSAARPV